MIKKEIKIIANFNYLSEKDMNIIEKQIDNFIDNTTHDYIDLTEIISTTDYYPYITQVTIKDGCYTVNVYLSDENFVPLISLPVKNISNKNEIEQVENEIQAYIIYYMLLKSALLESHFFVYGKNIIKMC